jgi:hypothetical protein
MLKTYKSGRIAANGAADDQTDHSSVVAPADRTLRELIPSASLRD